MDNNDLSFLKFLVSVIKNRNLTIINETIKHEDITSHDEQLKKTKFNFHNDLHDESEINNFGYYLSKINNQYIKSLARYIVTQNTLNLYKIHLDQNITTINQKISLKKKEDDWNSFINLFEDKDLQNYCSINTSMIQIENEEERTKIIIEIALSLIKTSQNTIIELDNVYPEIKQQNMIISKNICSIKEDKISYNSIKSNINTDDSFNNSSNNNIKYIQELFNKLDQINNKLDKTISELNQTRVDLNYANEKLNIHEFRINQLSKIHRAVALRDYTVGLLNYFFARKSEKNKYYNHNEWINIKRVIDKLNKSIDKWNEIAHNKIDISNFHNLDKILIFEDYFKMLETDIKDNLLDINSLTLNDINLFKETLSNIGINTLTRKYK